MATEPMTPGEDPFGPTINNTWTNRSIAYNQSFEDTVMRAVLSPPPHDGLLLLNEGESVPEDGGPSAPRSSIDPSTLPTFTLSELPLHLDHPSRTYRSTAPGIRYTHPGGLLEGGPGPGAPDAAAAAGRAEFAQNLIEEHRVRRANNFWQVVEKEKQDALKELEDRMRAREKAIKHNEDIEAQLVQKKEQRDLEVRVWERQMGMGKG